MVDMYKDAIKIIDHYAEFHTYRDLLRFLGYEYSKGNVKRVSTVLKENDITPKYISRCSKVSKLSCEELQNIVNNSKSFGEVLNYFNLKHTGGNCNTLKDRCRELNIDFTLLLQNKEQHGFANRRKPRQKYSSLDELINHTTSRRKIKKYIIDNNLLCYKCEKCSNIGVYNGEPLVLQLDHIDGNPINNVLENLRFLCPNCHSQTPTFSGKANKKEKRKCSLCEKKINQNSTTGQCNSCNIKTDKYSENYRSPRPRRFDITHEQMVELISNHSFTAIGAMYSVSGNAIKKRCIAYGIDISLNKFSHKK